MKVLFTRDLGLPSTRQGYIDMQSLHDLQTWDKVRVDSMIDSNSHGWDGIWYPSMDECVGKIYTVISNRGSRGILVSSLHSFPYYVLTKIEPDTRQGV